MSETHKITDEMNDYQKAELTRLKNENEELKSKYAKLIKSGKINKEKLIRECLMLYCFLEGIDPNEENRISTISAGLKELSMEKLEKTYKVNSKLKEVRLDRLLSY